jgi:hypothetical protein
MTEKRAIRDMEEWQAWLEQFTGRFTLRMQGKGPPPMFPFLVAWHGSCAGPEDKTYEVMFFTMADAEQLRHADKMPLRQFLVDREMADPPQIIEPGWRDCCVSVCLEEPD